ncbi:hypothetical protein V1527DRAFT_450501 [Lipomyces starkeyi]
MLVTNLPRYPIAVHPPSASLKRKVSVLRYDITRVAAEAIANAANNRLADGSGVNGAIQSTAGPQLLEESLTLNGCQTGDAKITKGSRLPARNVIHCSSITRYWRFSSQGKG